VQGWIDLRAGHRTKVTTLKPLQKFKSLGGILNSSAGLRCPHHVAHPLKQFRFVWLPR
jgi:hypothetical protein